MQKNKENYNVILGLVEVKVKQPIPRPPKINLLALLLPYKRPALIICRQGASGSRNIARLKLLSGDC